MTDTNLYLPLSSSPSELATLTPEEIAKITPPYCTKCELQTKRKQAIAGCGSYTPTIMYVGLQPTADDDMFARPAMGERGMLLERIVDRAGLPKRDIYYTYLVKCFSGEKSKKPKMSCIKQCADYLRKEILALKPKLVILEGPDVLKFLTQDRKSNMHLLQGAMLQIPEFPDSLFMPIYSIDSIYADYNYETQIVNNLRRGYANILNPNASKLPTTYLFIDNEDQLDKLFVMLKDTEYLSLDIETDGGPTFQKTKTTCWAISWAAGKAAYFPWLRDGNVPHWEADAQARVVEKWNTFLKNKKLILHNGKYDLKILRYGVGLTEGLYYFDTVISANIIDETQMSLKLKNLAWIHTDMGGYDDALETVKHKLKVSHDYSVIPREILKHYVCGDVDCTFRIFDKHRTELKEKNLEFLMYGIYMPVANIFMELEYAGVKVDVPYLDKLKVEYEAKLVKLDAAIQEAAGCKFDVNSSSQMSDVLFNKLKLPIIKSGKSKSKTQESSDKHVLTKLKGKHPVVELILEYRAAATLLNNFITTLLDLVDTQGFVHTTYNVATQATSRTSSQKPNLQNLPRSNKDIKKSFITRPGYEYYEFDFSQIEIRVLAQLSRDPKLIEDLNSGADIHRMMASTVYGVPFDKVTSDMRSNAKSVSFGIIYGMTWRTLAETKGMTDVAAKRLYNNFFSGYAGVSKWIADVKDFARKYKCVYTPFNRIRHLDGIDHPINSIRSTCERCAVNSPIQSMGADIPNLALINLINTYPPEQYDYKFCFQIHDAVILEINKDKAAEFAPKVKYLLETTEPLIVPTPVGCKKGPNLGEMEEIEL
jgi:DNA polymerase-1